MSDLTSLVDDAHQSVLRALPTTLIDITDIPGTRARIAAAQASVVRPPLPPGIARSDHLARLGDQSVPVRVYRPDTANGPVPAMVWIHGGGLVIGSIDENDDYCAELAHGGGIVVIAVDYRLAPEHPYPAALEDCTTALEWLVRETDSLGVLPDRIGVGGASAGGGLAAALAMVARDRSLPVVFQLLTYPMLDDRTSSASGRRITDPRVWNYDSNRAAWGLYLGELAGTDDVPVHAAPARAQVTDVACVAPACIAVGDLDLFYDEDRAYAKTLRRAGVNCELLVYPGAFHGSNRLVSRSALSRRWAADERAVLRRFLGTDPGL